jgi:hypothetical protein
MCSSSIFNNHDIVKYYEKVTIRTIVIGTVDPISLHLAKRICAINSNLLKALKKTPHFKLKYLYVGMHHKQRFL